MTGPVGFVDIGLHFWYCPLAECQYKCGGGEGQVRFGCYLLSNGVFHDVLCRSFVQSLPSCPSAASPLLGI